jgi:hypothetical protein
VEAVIRFPPSFNQLSNSHSTTFMRSCSGKHWLQSNQGIVKSFDMSGPVGGFRTHPMALPMDVIRLFLHLFAIYLSGPRLKF